MRSLLSVSNPIDTTKKNGYLTMQNVIFCVDTLKLSEFEIDHRQFTGTIAYFPWVLV